MIAVGIGVNTAVFSVINTVLLKPLTYPDPQSLFEMRNTSAQGSFPGANIPKFNIWRQQTGIFQQVAAYDFGGAGMNITGGDHPEQVQGAHVSAEYFPLFGAPIVAGRTFTAAEDSPHGGHVTVLSYGLWKSRYGADPKVVGTTIQLDGQPYLIVGVDRPRVCNRYSGRSLGAFPVRSELAGHGQLLHRGSTSQARCDPGAGQCRITACCG